MDSEPPSIHVLAPLESGGSSARNGFLFQDHVAARYCLEMVLTEKTLSVWCETLDDITVLRQAGEIESAEFVQVKAVSSDQLWSPSRLCQRQEGRPGTSILEKSLANDRCKEDCTFSIVTTRDLQSKLSPLSLPVGEPSRSDTISGLGATFVEKLPDCESPNGHNPAWWAERTTWTVLHSSEAAKNHNLLLLSRIVEPTAFVLFSDQVENIYELLLNRIMKASAADKNARRNAGKFEREKLRQWLTGRIKDVHENGRRAGSGLLIEKLEDAGLDGIAISTATELRRSYRAKTLEPSYLELDNVRKWEDKVRGLLNRLRASLDTGAISESGVGFHNRSLQALAQLRSEFDADSPPPDEMLQGCMYQITALCQHRFVRPKI